MKLSAILAPLIAANVPGSVILDTVKAFEEQAEAAVEQSKEKARARWHRWNDKQPTNVGKRLQTDTNASKQLMRVEDSSSKKDITGKEEKKDTAPAALSDLEAFRAEVSPLLDAERVDAIVKHRRAKKGQLTAHAARLFIADAKAAGLSLPDAVDTCISRNWITVKADWLNKPQATAPPKKTTLATMWRDEARDYGILPNDPPSQTNRHLDAGLPRGQDQGSGFARRIASA